MLFILVGHPFIRGRSHLQNFAEKVRARLGTEFFNTIYHEETLVVRGAGDVGFIPMVTHIAG